MSFKQVIAITLLAALLPLSTAQAEVKWPYVRDTEFGGYGYDTQGATGAQKVAMDGQDAIVAITTAVPGTDEVDVELLRYGANGALKPWGTAAGSPTHLPVLPLGSIHSILAVQDLKIDARGNIHLLLDVRLAGKSNSDVWMRSMRPNGTVYGTADVYSASSNQRGGQIMVEGDRLYTLATGAGFIQLSAWLIDNGQPPVLDTAWGNNGRQSHLLLLCRTASLPVTMCPVEPTHLARTPAPFTIPPLPQGGFYIGGSVTLNRNTPVNDDLFLLKLDANGARVSSFGNNGVVTWGTDDDERMAGMQVLSTGTFLSGTHDILALSAMDRVCGEGIIITRRSSSDGSQISRTFTHGGSGSGTSCDSIQAKDMVLAGSNRVAVVGTYVPSVFLEKNSAMLLTFNTDALNDSQDVQKMLGGGSAVTAPSYGFNAVARDFEGKRLMAVGSGSHFMVGGSQRVAMIAALKEKPLFSDGFED